VLVGGRGEIVVGDCGSAMVVRIVVLVERWWLVIAWYCGEKSLREDSCWQSTW